MGWAESPDEYWKRVETHAGEALKLDASDVRARILMARRYLAYNRHLEAQTQIDRAIAINPNDADALAGRGNVLMWLGKTDAAIESLELALRIDPELNDFDRFALTLAYYLKQRYNEAIEQAELNLRRNPGARFNEAVLAAAYAQVGPHAPTRRASAKSPADRSDVRPGDLRQQVPEPERPRELCAMACARRVCWPRRASRALNASRQ